MHRLTRTDVFLGSTKIPRKIAAAVHFEEQGVCGALMLMVGNSEKSHTTLPMTAALCWAARSGRSSQLAEAFAVNSAVLIGFSESMSGGVDILLKIKILG